MPLDQTQVTRRLDRLKDKMQHVNGSILTTSVMGVETVAAGIYVLEGLSPVFLGTCMTAVIALPTLLYALKTVSTLEVKPQGQESNADYQAYLKEMDEFIESFDKNVPTYQFCAQIMENYAQPTLLSISLLFASAYTLPKPNALEATTALCSSLLGGYLYARNKKVKQPETPRTQTYNNNSSRFAV